MSSYLNAHSTAHTNHLPDGRNYRFAGEDVGEQWVAIGGGGLGRGRKARPRSTVTKIYTAVARRGGIIPRSSFFPPPPPASAPPLRLGQAIQSSHHIDLYILSPLRPLDNTQWRTLHPPESGTPGSSSSTCHLISDNPLTRPSAGILAPSPTMLATTPSACWVVLLRAVSPTLVLRLLMSQNVTCRYVGYFFLSLRRSVPLSLCCSRPYALCFLRGFSTRTCDERDKFDFGRPGFR